MKKDLAVLKEARAWVNFCHCEVALRGLEENITFKRAPLQIFKRAPLLLLPCLSYSESSAQGFGNR